MSTGPARKLVFAVVAAGLCLGALEVLAAVSERTFLARVQPEPRAGSPRTPVLAHEAIPLSEDPLHGWALPPGQRRGAGGTLYRTNALGLRGPEIGPEEPREVRLLTLGDSTIYGDGVGEDETFHSVAARMLSSRWSRPVRSINGGVPGYDTSQSLTLLRRVAETVHPAVVVVANVWSDLFDGRLHLGEEGIGLSSLTALPRRSALYRMSRLLLGPRLAARQVRFAADSTQLGALEGDSQSRTPLRAYLANLRKLANTARELGAEPVFIAPPAPVDLEDLPLPESLLAFRAAMESVANEVDAPYLDLGTVFKAEHASPGEFFDQVHPGTDGHRRMGAALARLIDEAGLQQTPDRRMERSSPPTLGVDPASSARDLLMQLSETGPARVAAPGAVPLGPELRAGGGPPGAFLGLTQHRRGEWDAWIAGDHLGAGPRLSIPEECVEPEPPREGGPGTDGPHDASLVALPPTWQDLGEVPATVLYLWRGATAGEIIDVLPLLPPSPGGVWLLESPRLQRPSCADARIDSPGELAAALASAEG